MTKLPKEVLPKRFPKDCEKAPSEDFMDLLCDGGTLVQECYCGRVHFGSENAGDWEPGEYEGLMQKQKDDPEKYMQSLGDMVSYGWFIDRVYVWRCPCNWIEPYERFIWGNRDIICEYLIKRSGEDYVNAVNFLRAVRSAARAVKKDDEKKPGRVFEL